MAPDTNNGTRLGGIGNVISKVLTGYLMGKDSRDEADAMRALRAGLQPIPSAPPAALDPEAHAAFQMEQAQGIIPAPSPGGYQGAVQALAGLGDNPHAGRLAAQLMMQQAAAQQKRDLASVDQVSADEAARMGLPPGVYQKDANGKIAMIGSSSGRPASPIQNFAMWQEIVAKHGKGSPEESWFNAAVRANQIANLGNEVNVLSGVTGTPVSRNAVGLPPGRKITDERVIVDPSRPGLKMGQPAAVGSLDPAAQAALAAETGEIQGGQDDGRPVVQNLPKTQAQSRAATNAYAELNTKTGLVTQDIDRALGLANNWTVGLGSMMSGIPGTPAHNLSALLGTIKANVGFDQLFAIREASPTGGALGNVTERENTLLQTVMGALEQSQSAAQFRFNLGRLKEVIAGREARMAKAYEQDFGAAQSGGQPRQPTGWSIRRVQ